MNPLLLYFLIALNPFYGVQSGVQGMAYIPVKQEAMVTIKPQVIIGKPSEFDLLLQEHFGSAWQEAKSVANCESHLNPRAGENGYNIGLFQINIYGKLALSRPSKEWLLNAENNISYASKIFKSHGTFKKAWVICSKKVGAR